VVAIPEGDQMKRSKKVLKMAAGFTVDTRSFVVLFVLSTLLFVAR
jgi:hypothetical protein